MDPVYIVSSFHRSGSSMMMRCLEAGGLTAVYDTMSDGMNVGTPEDYTPNPNGFYQYTGDVTPDFYESYKGKLVKLYFPELNKLPQGKYKVIFMLREPEEIRASMGKWTPYQSWGTQEAATYFYAEIIDALTKIPGLDFVFVHYADVVEDPYREFVKLRNAGVPINVEFAAAKVDASLYRLRLERR